MASRRSPHLLASDNELRERFAGLSHPRHVASLLEIDYATFTYWLHRSPAGARYETFPIPKRSGGYRLISSPSPSIKILQKKLNRILHLVYRPKLSVQAFTAKRSVLTNARFHLRRRFVLNLDLEDFFPSITFRRVRGMFMAVPYCLPPKAATTLAQVACNQHGLPQGGPSSPIISNMICAKMDSQLLRLARRHNCTYTRYADDLTFSTNRTELPAAFAIKSGEQVELGTELQKIIESNGFRVNVNKLRLAGRRDRQEVTGVTVNQRPNVRRRLIREVRAMLHAWEKWGLENAEKVHSGHYRKHRHPNRAKPPFEAVLRGKINYVGMIRGKGDPLYIRLRSRLAKLDGGDRWQDLKSPEGQLRHALWVVEGEGTQGTGFSLCGVGLITCRHVVEHVIEEGKAVVFRSNHPWDKYPVAILAEDEGLDVAVLQTPPTRHSELDADSDTQIQIGMPVTVTGFPQHHYGDEIYSHDGHVTQLRSSKGLFLVSADIVGGNSGGPVLAGGKVVGLAVTGSDRWEESAPLNRDNPFGVIPIARVMEWLKGSNVLDDLGKPLPVE